jgi:hypothetical protein
MKFIKIMLAAAATCCAALGASAETVTYSLPASEIISQITAQMQKSANYTKTDNYTKITTSAAYADTITCTTFTHDGVEWNMEINWHTQSNGGIIAYTSDYTLANVTSINLTTKSLPLIKVDKITVATELTKAYNKDNDRIYSSIDGNFSAIATFGTYKKTARLDASKLDPYTTAPLQLSASPKEKYVDREFTVSLQFVEGYYGRITVPTITIQYDPDNTITEATATPEAVGTKKAYLIPASKHQTLYYAIDDAEWQKYDDVAGIDIEGAMGKTLRFYAAQTGKSNSPVQAVTLSNVQTENPQSISEATNRYEQITLSGYIVGQTEQYTLIADAVDSTNAIAVDNSDVTALKSCDNGTAVTVTGRTSDRFGRASLTSVTAASAFLNNEQTELAVSASAATPSIRFGI